MKVLIFADCMAIDRLEGKGQSYPNILMESFPEHVFDLITLDGQTTYESILKLKEIKGYDLVIYGIGINDSLPRGLSREQRSRLIQYMYKLRMSKKQRMVCRKMFLNPLEHLLQRLREPKHYYKIEETLEHLNQVKNHFVEQNTRMLFILINPIGNYRFVNANHYIHIYNEAIKRFCDENNFGYVNTEVLFLESGIENVLAEDSFHYSAKGHEEVAKRLVKKIENI